MALLRDVNFADYETSPLALAAALDLSRLSDFRGPKQGNKVTAQTLFRGFTPGDVAGPYVSQFLLKSLEYGAIHIDQKINTYLPLTAGGADYMTDRLPARRTERCRALQLKSHRPRAALYPQWPRPLGVCAYRCPV